MRFPRMLFLTLLLMTAAAFSQTTTTYPIDAPQNLGRAFGNSFRTFSVSFDGANIYQIEGQTSPGYRVGCASPAGNGTGFLSGLSIGDEDFPCINATSFTMAGHVINGRCSGVASATETFDGFDANSLRVSGSVTFNFTYIYSRGGGGKGGGGAGCYTYAIGGELSVTR